MTSTNDGKDVKSNQTSGQKGKTFYIELYKSLDSRLNADTSSEERTQLVCQAWRCVHSICQHSTPKTHLHLLAWLQRHTSYTILQSDWPKATDTSLSKQQHQWLGEALEAFIVECREAIAQRDGVSQAWENQLIQRAEWFKTTLTDPWGHTVLRALLQSLENQLSDEEVISWLKEERGVTFVTRLRQLAASRRCRELALRLASAVMGRARSSVPLVPDSEQATDQQNATKTESIFITTLQREAGFQTEVWNLIIDIEFVLLHSESQSRCIELAKQTPLNSCYNVVKRLQTRLETSPRDKKIWKNAKEVATLIAQVVIARCMVLPQCSGGAARALYRSAGALVALVPPPQLPAAAAALAAPARTALHLHTLAEAMHAQCNDSKPFVCELYIRAITAGMNELEQLKLKTEKESEARYMEQTLSEWFIELGSLLSASSRLSCECLLTSFSVHPSQKMYERVKTAPHLEPIHKDIQEPDPDTNSEFGSWATDSRTQTNLVKTSETLNIKSEKQTNVLSTATFTEGEALGLEAELCQDLAVLISGPRVKTLTWDMDRDSLLENCRTHMERTHSGTRALTTELKYLNLDPRSFQHLPEEDEDENDVYYGIEKGYEHLVEKPDDIFEDEFIYEAEQTELHNPEEAAIDIPKRRKKKSKYIQQSSEEEVDPLSFDDTNRPEKQERPHSKERRKVKHKNKEAAFKDTDESKEHSQEKTKEIRKKEKKKERKERKKKEKVDAGVGDIVQTPKGTLSRLIGMKVAKDESTVNIKSKSHSINMCALGTDYDSQGVSSNNSELNDTRVIFDGLFSMDEIKSPEKTVASNIERPITKYEISESMNVGLNKTNITTLYGPVQSQKVQSVPVGQLIVPYQPNNHVKKSIKKLLEYRRNKMVTHSKNALSISTLPNNLKQSPQLLNASNTYTGPSSTNGPNDIVKSYSQQSKTLEGQKVIAEPIDIVLPANVTPTEKANENITENKRSLQYSPYSVKKVSQTIKQNASDTKQPIAPASRQLMLTNIDMSQRQYEEFLKQRRSIVIKKQPTKSCYNTLSKIQHVELLKNQSNNDTDKIQYPSIKQHQQKNVRTVQTQEVFNKIISPTQANQNFLKELRESANAGAIDETADIKVQPKLEKTVPRQQKKVDNAPNTFSRRNYLHKSKQNDTKLRPELETKRKLNISMEDMHKLGVDYNKVTKLHAKGELVISRVDAKNIGHNQTVKTISVDHTVSTNSFSQKQKKSLLNHQHPIMSQMLSINESIKVNPVVSNEIKSSDLTQVNIPKSNLSDKDQNDLLLILRQQSYLNPIFTPNVDIENSGDADFSKINQDELDQAFEPPIKTKDQVAYSESKKSRTLKASHKNSKQTPRNSNNNSSKSDWESVMNALLAHKTPSRGPNALDVALKKDSFERRLPRENMASSSSRSNPSTNKQSILKQSCSKTNIKSKLIVKKSTEDSKSQSDKGVIKFANPRNTNIESLKTAQIRTKEKHISNVIQNGNDPFISGIPNSDFDLLSDLMDDDLRQEIGELLADDEAYGVSATPSKTKNVPTNELFLVTNKTKTTRKPHLVIDARHIKPERSSCITSYQTNPDENLQMISNNLIQTKSVYNSHTTSQSSKPRIISDELVTGPKLLNKPNTEEPSNVHVNNNIIANGPYSNEGYNLIRTNVDRSKFKTSNLSIINPTQVVLTVPQRTSNVMLISNEVIYDPYAVPQTLDQNCTNYESNSYLTLGQNPLTETLFSTPSYPVIYDTAISVPAIPSVPNLMSDVMKNIQSVQRNANSVEQSSASCERLLGPSYENCKKNYEKLNTECVNIGILSNSATNIEESLSKNNKDIFEEIAIDENSFFGGNKSTTIAARNLNNNMFKGSAKDTSTVNNKISENDVDKVLAHVQENKSTINDTKSIEGLKHSKEFVVSNLERLWQKRQGILNRQINNHSKNNPIPLTYEPIIKTACQEIKTNNKVTRKEKVIIGENKTSTDYQLIDENRIENIFQTNKSSDTVISCESNTQEIIVDNVNNNSNSITSCRSIVVRSPYDIKQAEKSESSVICSKSKMVKEKGKHVKNDKVINRLHKMNRSRVIKFKKSKTKSRSLSKEPEKIGIGKYNVSHNKSLIKSELQNISITNNTAIDENVPYVDVEEQIQPSIIRNCKKELHRKPLDNLKTLKKQDQNFGSKHKFIPDLVPIELKRSLNNDDQSDQQSNSSESINNCDITNDNLKLETVPNKNTDMKNSTKCIKNVIKTVKYKNNIVLKDQTGQNKCENPKEPKPKDKEKVTHNFIDVDDKITIQDLPGDSNNPNVKCVRIKVRNGSSFKVTISGKSNVDMKEIFEEPSIKAMILKNMNNNKKCTLNVKQIKSSGNSSRITTHVQDVSHLKYNEKETETIDLVSDDEDNTLKTFNTEFGTYDCNFVENDMFLKHQEKLSQKCIVNMVRCNVPQEFSLKTVLDDNKSSVEQPELQENLVEDIILIDESSDDCKEKSENERLLNEESRQDNIEPEIIENTEQSEESLVLSDPKINDNTVKPDDEIVNHGITCKEVNNVVNKKCVLKIDRCDELIEKFKIQTKQCFVSLVRCDDCCNNQLLINNDSKQPIKESEDDENLIKENVLNVTHLRIDPSLNEFESLVCNQPPLKEFTDEVKLEGESSLTESSLQVDSSVQRCESPSILNESFKELQNEKILDIDDTENNIPVLLQRCGSPSLLNDVFMCADNKSICSSPSLIENFDIPLMLYDELPLCDSMQQVTDIKCSAEWCMTKSSIHNLKRNVKSYESNFSCPNETTSEDKLTDCESDVENNMPIDYLSVNRFEDHNDNKNVPRLTKIITNFFANNDEVINKLMSIKKECRTVTTPLKRKIVDNKDKRQHKMLKVESTVVTLNTLDHKNMSQINDSENNSQHAYKANVIDIGNDETISSPGNEFIVTAKDDNFDRSVFIGYKCGMKSGGCSQLKNAGNDISHDKIKYDNNEFASNITYTRANVKDKTPEYVGTIQEQVKNRKTTGNLFKSTLGLESQDSIALSSSYEAVDSSEFQKPSSCEQIRDILCNERMNVKLLISNTKPVSKNLETYRFIEKVSYKSPDTDTVRKEFFDSDYVSQFVEKDDDINNTYLSKRNINSKEKLELIESTTEVIDEKNHLIVNETFHCFNEKNCVNEETPFIINQDLSDTGYDYKSTKLISEIKNTIECQRSFTEENEESNFNNGQQINFGVTQSTSEQTMEFLDMTSSENDKSSDLTSFNKNCEKSGPQHIKRNRNMQKNVTLVYKGESSLVLNGSIYEDPFIGTCYVFPILNKVDITGDSDTIDDAKISIVEDSVNKNTNSLEDDLDDKENMECENLKLNVIIPNITYSKSKIDSNISTSKPNRIQLKRKIEACDTTCNNKKYRKGKNIDNPKLTIFNKAESTYEKEYKNLFNYWSSIKFSFSRPFHKECIDVFDMLKCWPILEVHCEEQNYIESNSSLFIEDNIPKNNLFDPMQQTLADEISSEYVEAYSNFDEINETNFNMGFGEGSDRVISNVEDKEKFSKISAATLSDVKQCQPCLKSGDYDKYAIHTSKVKQIEICKRFFHNMELRDKVRSFFKKSSLYLHHNRLMENNEKKSDMDLSSKDLCAYDIFNTDFIDPAPMESVVNVVQVGQQLPVSAAVQNPVTCDPRVTQVNDASPQCSEENSPQEDAQSPVKSEYIELTTADISVPLLQEHRQLECQEYLKVPAHNENIPVEIEICSEGKSNIRDGLSLIEREENSNKRDNLQVLVNKHIKDEEYPYEINKNQTSAEAHAIAENAYEHFDKNNIELTQRKQQNGVMKKRDQIAHAMSAAGITPSPEPVIDSETQALVDMFSPKISQSTTSTHTSNNYSKTSINAMMLQQALAHILPPPLSQTNTQENNQVTSNSSVGSQVLHIVQGKNSSGNQITVVENTQNSVINSNTPVLHIVQNKGVNQNSTSNTNNSQHANSFSGLSLVDTGLQQVNNQLLHIVNTGNQKNNVPGQILKRVNLLTNLANVQGATEQKMVQFVCKSADGKSIQLNAPHQRSMVLRLQPFDSTNIQNNSKAEGQDLNSPSNNVNISSNKELVNGQNEIKSRSIYEENYAKFIQSSNNKTVPENSTSLPKFNQAFGKQVFQDGSQKTIDLNTNNSHLPSLNTDCENSECQSNETSLNLEQIRQISSPPLLLRKTTAPSIQTQANIVQQIKQTIAPMMHGGVIYTRQIPVNIGGGQTINLITVPSTELVDDSNQKHQAEIKFINQNDMETPVIKVISQNQNTEMLSDESNKQTSASNENTQNPPTQHQPVLTQMRIKLPMLSKAPQMVSGARVVRPSFFQIQRNVIGGANQPVYQQLVLTAAPPLGQHTIRLPQTQTRNVKVTEGQSSSESQMSTSTLEQLREFDMVLEQVKERSTVQPNSINNFSKQHTTSSDTTDSTSVTSTVTESTQQILYSIGTNQSVNVAYVNRRPTTTMAYIRSPDSSSLLESPSSSTHSQIPHTVSTESTSSEVSPQQSQPKAAKIGSKSKSRLRSSSQIPNALKINTVPPKTSTQKPLEDEQTTQRILYILAEYKEQVENSPDKDKPAPRRRSNPPSNPSGSCKRKKSSSGSRRPGVRDCSPVQGDDTCRTMGSEDSSCGTSQGDCTETCQEPISPQDSPRKVVRKLTFENETETTTPAQPKQHPQRNVILADGQTITVSRGSAGKPTTAVLMPANYILPVSMVKGGQQIAIVTNRGPKLLTVGGETGNALLLQRLIGPAGLKPVLTRPGVRHVRLPSAALHNLQAFNLAATTTVNPQENAPSPSPAQTPHKSFENRASCSPWTDRESQDIKPERSSSPEGSEPWHLTDPNDYSYEETVRTENLDRTVLDANPDRYSPDMEAQRIFDKMFDVDSKRSYIVDSQDDTSRCAYDIDASDCDDKAYHQVVHKRDGHRRLAHISAAALRHKYAILEHELRLQGIDILQKSLSEECEDLGVDSPSASELFPEAELLFNSSPAHDAQQNSHTPQPTPVNQGVIPQPYIDDQMATDHLLQNDIDDQQDLGVTLGLDEGIVTVSEDGMQATIALDQEEFARSHPNTTFHSEPTEETDVQPYTVAGFKGRHITSTIFHAGRAPATVLVTAPQATVISQAIPDNGHHTVKYNNIDHIINSSNGNLNLTKFDNLLTDTRELHLSNTASAIVHSTGNATQVIRRVCYDDDRRDSRYLMNETDALIAGDDAKMVAEESSREATLESIPDADEDNSSPERHAELFWETNSASERSERGRHVGYNYSSDSEKCCKSPFDETNSTDSSGVGTHMRLDSVIKEARFVERAASGSSDDHPPLRTYPAKRLYHHPDDVERSLSGKTRAGFLEDKYDRAENMEGRRRSSVRGVVKRGCHCCNGSPVPTRPKKTKKKPTIDFTN